LRPASAKDHAPKARQECLGRRAASSPRPNGPAEHARAALDSLRARLAALYGAGASHDLRRAGVYATEAVLEIPLAPQDVRGRLGLKFFHNPCQQG
jgi:hypothetical protein